MIEKVREKREVGYGEKLRNLKQFCSLIEVGTSCGHQQDPGEYQYFSQREYLILNYSSISRGLKKNVKLLNKRQVKLQWLYNGSQMNGDNASKIRFKSSKTFWEKRWTR